MLGELLELGEAWGGGLIRSGGVAGIEDLAHDGADEVAELDVEFDAESAELIGQALRGIGVGRSFRVLGVVDVLQCQLDDLVDATIGSGGHLRPPHVVSVQIRNIYGDCGVRNCCFFGRASDSARAVYWNMSVECRVRCPE